MERCRALGDDRCVSTTSPLGRPDLGFAHDWALVDVETSGLRPGQHRVLSVAVIAMDSMGEVTGEYSTLLNPGCDPGPVHIHGLTERRLRGAPTFDEVAPVLAELLAGRVLVAHHASFDYGFLAAEFARTATPMPVTSRLCTVDLNRRLRTPTADLKLATLAQHYGVQQRHAHDAVDDTRVLAEVFRFSLAQARDRGIDVPLTECVADRRAPVRDPR